MILLGASNEDAVGDACGAGTHCGTCLDRIEEILVEEEAGAVRVG